MLVILITTLTRLMNAPYDELKLAKTIPVHEQIRQHIRELIVCGKLVPEQRLPSDKELARRWGTHKPTVHLALSALVREGLLVRVNRVGTFVRQREAKLTCVAVLAIGNISDSLYTQALHKALQEELGRVGIETPVWLDSRPVAGIHGALAAFFAGRGAPGISSSDHYGVEQSASWLAHEAAGANRVPVRARPPELGWLGPRAFCRVERADTGQARLPVRGTGDWRLAPPPRILSTSAGSDCRSRVDREERLDPDTCGDGGYRRRGGPGTVRSRGVSPTLGADRSGRTASIVYPDTVARGVILGLLEKQVRVPAELKLVLHKNEAVGLYCPLPAMLLVSSERKLARALLQQVRKQFRGERCEQILLTFDRAFNAGN